MDTTMLVLGILLLNTVIAVVVMVVMLLLKKGHLSYMYAATIFFIPVLSELYYVLSFIVYHFTPLGKGLTYKDISFDATRREKKRKADIQKEVDILPLEEAFMVSNNADRRRALLDALKSDYSKSMATIMRGVNNEDGETSHYAASVVMSTITEYLNRINDTKKIYDEASGEEKLEAAYEYLDTLQDFVNSEVVDRADERKYVNLFVEILSWVFESRRDKMRLDDYLFAIEHLVNMEEFGMAKIWSDRAFADFPTEDGVYNQTLRLYYESHDSEKFLGLLNELMGANINISNETLQTIRYFTYRG